MVQTTEQQLADELLGVVEEFWFDGTDGSPRVAWYEERLFNESRLYEELGKEDARTVLGVWRRFKAVVAVVEKLRAARKVEAYLEN